MLDINSINIKYAEELDAEDIYEIRKAAKAYSYTEFTDLSKDELTKIIGANAAQRIEKIALKIRSGKHQWRIAIVNGNIKAGFIRYSTREKSPKIIWLFVKPEFQRMGIGSELLIHALEELKNSPVIRLRVIDKNTKAIELYKRFGFQVELKASKRSFIFNSQNEINTLRMIKNNNI